MSGEPVPWVGRLGVAGTEYAFGHIHPSGVFADHPQRVFVEFWSRVEQDAPCEGRIVGVASKIVAFEPVFFGPGCTFVNDNHVGGFAREIATWSVGRSGGALRSTAGVGFLFFESL